MVEDVVDDDVSIGDVDFAVAVHVVGDAPGHVSKDLVEILPIFCRLIGFDTVWQHVQRCAGIIAAATKQPGI